MFAPTWSAAEKKIARRAFESARAKVLDRLVADFKARAQAAETPSDVWEIEDFLRHRRREIDELLDYRYSQLPLVFARLVREGYLDPAALAGVSDDKLTLVRSFPSLPDR